MSSHSILADNAAKLKENADFVIRFLRERERVRPEPTGLHPTAIVVEYPYRDITLDDPDGAFLFELVQEQGKILGELKALRIVDRDVATAIASVESAYREAFGSIIRIQQNDGKQYGYFYGSWAKFRDRVHSLQELALIEGALVMPSEDIQRVHMERLVKNKIKDIERKQVQVRRQVYFKGDSDASKLAKVLLTTSDDKILDQKYSHLLFLAGFDYEILNHKQGDIDVLAYNTHDDIAILIEGTTGNMPKSKVDQIYGRREEYLEFFAKHLKPGTTILLLVVTNREKDSLDKLGLREAMLNKVSIFTAKELNELINMLRNGKLDKFQVIEMMRKCIPIV